MFEVGSSNVRIRPSKALWAVEERAYRDELESWRSETVLRNRQRWRSIVKDKVNAKRYRSLERAVKARQVVPFVGAGLSIPTGCPGWSDFLLDLASESDDGEVFESLIDKGRYEEAAEKLYYSLGANLFDDRVRTAFEISQEDLLGPVRLLPFLFCGCVTTNLDNVLDKVYQQSIRGLTHRMTWHDHDNLARTTSSGDSWILKLHGHYEDPANRIFLRFEYEKGYDGDDQKDPVLVGLLEEVFVRLPLLFLGCSLKEDRTLRVFKAVVEKRGRRIPQHYAILEAPVRNRMQREKFLTERGIFPIWYPSGQHDYVEAILAQLKKAVESTP